MARRNIIASETSVGTLLGVEPYVWARVKEAIAKAAAVVQAEAEGMAPFKTGELRGSIEVKESDTDAGPRATVGTDSYVGRFWEYGFGGKTVKVRPRGATWSRRRGYEIRGRSANSHQRRIPRQQHPFLRPALENNRENIRAMIRQALGVS